MSYSNFIEDIRIAARTIADHDLRAINEGYHILNYGRILPNIVGSSATKIGTLCRSLESGVNSIKTGVERHHCGDEARLNVFVFRQLKNTRPLSTRL